MQVMGISGLPGSGKGLVSDMATERGAIIVSMGDIIREEAKKRGESTKETAKNLRKEKGEYMLPIYENFDKSFTVDELARMARMSRTAYIQRFKRVTGRPPKRFLTEYRISVAQKLLAEGGQTEAEIAHLVGCYDTSHLIKMMKRQ